MAKKKRKVAKKKNRKVVILDYDFAEWVELLREILGPSVEVESRGSPITEKIALLVQLVDDQNAICIWVYDLGRGDSRAAYKQGKAQSGGCKQHWFGILASGKPAPEVGLKRTFSPETTVEQLAEEIVKTFEGVEA